MKYIWDDWKPKSRSVDASSKNLVPSPKPIDVVAQLAALKSLVLDSLSSKHSRRSYDKSLTAFLAWYAAESPGRPFTQVTMMRYAWRLAEEGKAASTQNVRLAAVRRLAAKAVDSGVLAPKVAAEIVRVRGPKAATGNSGNWLTVDQAKRLIDAPDTTTLIGKRDRALLAVMLGSGLSRVEISEQLTLERIQQTDDRWAIVDIRGKGDRLRTVPIPGWAKLAIDVWIAAAGLTTGIAFRSMNNKGQVVGKPLPPQNILEVVRKYAKRAFGRGREASHLMKLSPNDLRRTFAKLAHMGHAPLEQIQLNLGHVSIVTTEKYLGTKRQDLKDAPCDHLGLRL
jgi:site-specific recombinase XerD